MLQLKLLYLRHDRLLLHAQLLQLLLRLLAVRLLLLNQLGLLHEVHLQLLVQLHQRGLVHLVLLLLKAENIKPICKYIYYININKFII